MPIIIVMPMPDVLQHRPVTSATVIRDTVVMDIHVKVRILNRRLLVKRMYEMICGKEFIM